MWNQPAHGASHHFSFHNSFNSPRNFDRSQLPTYPRSNSVDSVMGDQFQTQAKRPKFEFSFSHADHPFLGPPRDRAATPPNQFSNTRFRFESHFHKPPHQQQQRKPTNFFCIPGLGGDSPTHTVNQSNMALPFSFNPSQFEKAEGEGMSHYTKPQGNEAEVYPGLSFEAHRWHDKPVPKTFRKEFGQTKQGQQTFQLGSELWRDPKLQKLARDDMERDQTQGLERSWSGDGTPNQFPKQVGGGMEKHIRVHSGGRAQWHDVSPRQRTQQVELNGFQVPSFCNSQTQDAVRSNQMHGRHTKRDTDMVYRGGQSVNSSPRTQAQSQQMKNVEALGEERVNTNNVMPVYDPSLEEQRRHDEIKRIREIGERFAREIEQRAQHQEQVVRNEHKQTRIENRNLRFISTVGTSALFEDEAKHLREENERLRELLKEKESTCISQETAAKLCSVHDQVVQLKEEEERRFREEAEMIRKIEIEQKIRDKVKEMREREKRISQEQSGQLITDEASESSLNVGLAPTPRTPSPVEPPPLFHHINPSHVANSNSVRLHPLFTSDAAQVPDVSTTQPTNESSSLSPSSFSFNLEAYTSSGKKAQQTPIKPKMGAPKLTTPPPSQLRPLMQFEISSKVQRTSSKPPSLMEIDTTSPIKGTQRKRNVNRPSVTCQSTLNTIKQNKPPSSRRQGTKTVPVRPKHTSQPLGRPSPGQPSSQTNTESKNSPVLATSVFLNQKETGNRPCAVQQQSASIIRKTDGSQPIKMSSKAKVSHPPQSQTAGKECQLCKTLVSDLKFWDAHVNSPRHQNLAAGNKDTSQKGILSFSFFCSVCDSVCHSELSYLQHVNSKKHTENFQRRSEKATSSNKTLNKTTPGTSVRKEEPGKEKVFTSVLVVRSGKKQSQLVATPSLENLQNKTSPSLSTRSTTPSSVKKRIIKLKRPWNKNGTDQSAGDPQGDSSRPNSRTSLNSSQPNSRTALNCSQPNSRTSLNKEKEDHRSISVLSIQRPSSGHNIPLRRSPLLAVHTPQRSSVTPPPLTIHLAGDKTAKDNMQLVKNIRSVPQFDCPEIGREEDIGCGEDDDELQIHPELNEFEEDSLEVGSQPKKGCARSVHESRSVERNFHTTGGKEYKRGVPESRMWQKKQRPRLNYKPLPNHKPVPVLPNRQTLMSYSHHQDRSGYHGDYYGNYQHSVGAHPLLMSFVVPPKRYQAPPARPYFQPHMPPQHFFNAPYLKFGTP